MKKFWLRLSKRERTIFFFALSLFALVVARYLVINPYLARRAWVKDQLEVKYQQLENQNRYLGRGKELEEQFKVLRARLKDLESSLLEGDTAPVTASALQETVREIAAKEGVQIVATRVLNPEPVGSFLKVPIQVEVDGAVEQVTSLIKGIDSAGKLLVVKELTIRSLRPRARRRRQRRAREANKGLRASMVIAGFSRPSNGSSTEEESPAP